MDEIANATSTVDRSSTVRYRTKTWACGMIWKIIYFYINFVEQKLGRSETRKMKTLIRECGFTIGHKSRGYCQSLLKWEIFPAENSIDFELLFQLTENFNERDIKTIKCSLYEIIVSLKSVMNQLDSQVAETIDYKYKGNGHPYTVPANLSRKNIRHLKISWLKRWPKARYSQEKSDRHKWKFVSIHLERPKFSHGKNE